MKNLIWDLDGTLIDSYGIILQSLEETFSCFQLDFDYEETKNYISRYSVVKFLKDTSEYYSISYDKIKTEFSRRTSLKNSEITLMPDALSVLKWSKKQGMRNYIYTHKSNNALKVLYILGILDYFDEVVTSSNGFKRKPDSEAVFYLINKYSLKRDETCYIGDRKIDVDVAVNSGIKSINLSQPDSDVNRKIDELSDLCKMEWFHQL